MAKLEELIVAYGYLAVLVGTFLEGETLLLAAGFACQRGMLSLPMVMVISTIGATAGDQFFFYLGRHRREWIFRRFPSLQVRAAAIYRWIERYPDLLIIASRFVYGFRLTTPVVLGTSQVGAGRYSLFNFIGAIIWSVLVAGAGYFLGEAIESIFGDIQAVQKELMLIIVGGGILLWCFHRVRSVRKTRAAALAIAPKDGGA